MNKTQKSIQVHLADGPPNDSSDRAVHVCEPDEVVPGALRKRLRWDWQHDAAAAEAMQEYGLSLPKDRELTRQLAVTRVAWGKPEWLSEEPMYPLYGTRKWRNRRAQQLRIEPLCRLCLAEGKVVAATVADHIWSPVGPPSSSLHRGGQIRARGTPRGVLKSDRINQRHRDSDELATMTSGALSSELVRIRYSADTAKLLGGGLSQKFARGAIVDRGDNRVCTILSANLRTGALWRKMR